MATIILSHDVKDFAAWKPHYDGDSPRREGAGFKQLAVGTDASNPNKVYMIWQGDPKVLEKMLQDPELGAKMKEAGVISKPEVIVINS
ncbi:MAG: hypothetical protein OEV74_14485 [Cyclobacteriaceae bacterium]|nr:hypothetical protein [Cyclobacteriaceae bacterium]MDH4297489.1 hypothetical protein [Cyclobacteriaceae bacterium]MDH5249691.1 hypothetical protein [Cyclobacteriaceae bacterium]